MSGGAPGRGRACCFSFAQPDAARQFRHPQPAAATAGGRMSDGMGEETLCEGQVLHARPLLAPRKPLRDRLQRVPRRHVPGGEPPRTGGPSSRVVERMSGVSATGRTEAAPGRRWLGAAISPLGFSRNYGLYGCIHSDLGSGFLDCARCALVFGAGGSFPIRGSQPRPRNAGHGRCQRRH